MFQTPKDPEQNAIIVEFAELPKVRNMKLKNFSSGMYARLAFATAAATEPDVLLIDEVLAVGDAAFQRKCKDRKDEIEFAPHIYH